jgi:hypothetical protein
MSAKYYRYPMVPVHKYRCVVTGYSVGAFSRKMHVPPCCCSERVWVLRSSVITCSPSLPFGIALLLRTRVPRYCNTRVRTRGWQYSRMAILEYCNVAIVATRSTVRHTLNTCVTTCVRQKKKTAAPLCVAPRCRAKPACRNSVECFIPFSGQQATSRAP